MDRFAQQTITQQPQTLEPTRGDEVETLSFTFDRMADRIGQQIELLQQQDALRRRLVAQVSHDLRTPLASMLGYLESLQIKKDSLSEEQRDEFLRIALHQGHRLGRMLAELFELASLEARESQPCPEPFALPELIYDAVEKHRLKADSRGLSLTLSISPDNPFVYGDIGMTERVLDNLLDNAIEHTPSGGSITVAVSCNGDRASVSIRDSGPGIQADQLPHIFDPFYRGATIDKTDSTDNTNSADPSTQHACLGLAIAKRIMDMQNGTIRATNVAVGSGSVFSFELPLQQP
jgi:signal transduction histidine kinase